MLCYKWQYLKNNPDRPVVWMKHRETNKKILIQARSEFLKQYRVMTRFADGGLREYGFMTIEGAFQFARFLLK